MWKSSACDIASAARNPGTNRYPQGVGVKGKEMAMVMAMVAMERVMVAMAMAKVVMARVMVVMARVMVVMARVTYSD